MLRSARQPVLSLLLVLTCVYQLGACPCGCLEHNGWYQAFHESAEHFYPKGDDKESEFDHQDCTGQDQPATRPDVRSSDSERRAAEAAFCFTPTCSETSHQHITSASFWQNGVRPTLPVRDLLQVYLF